ncbi:MAG: hypothetical protein KDD67_15375, partial [Ignavibacteriae bacterium]|nr:hypothetical protein [Ignavibacteriota bacterium]
MQIRFFPKLILLISAFLSGAILACGEMPSKSVATIGTVEITQQSLDYRAAIQAAYGGDTLPMPTALVAAGNDALAEDVAASLGLTPTSEEIQQFVSHVDETSKAPDILQKVKNVFGEDSLSYINIYLKPKVVEAKLQRYQAFDTAAQNDGRRRIQQAYAVVAEGKSFAEAASVVGGIASVDTFTTATKPTVPEELAKFGQGNSDPHPLAVLAEQHLKPGVVFQQVVEDDKAYRIVRLLDRNSERSIVEIVSIAKGDYHAWLRKRAEGIPIVLHDKNLA